ncbi:unnamed protein product [Cyprideis torosa]|uniref:Uncharacterized protein n=1 Tax=Cyprideis torosa TaxID=163714 RepID=A0A7R8W1Q1_9CRUS|nr:unnamed protein product [Cyprideis torosa]CAG0881224.1 unnamed protein product [Cyprideis torosa]
MDLVNLLNIVEVEVTIPRRQIQNRSDPLQYFSDEEFRDRFRMRKGTFAPRHVEDINPYATFQLIQSEPAYALCDAPLPPPGFTGLRRPKCVVHSPPLRGGHGEAEESFCNAETLPVHQQRPEEATSRGQPLPPSRRGEPEHPLPPPPQYFSRPQYDTERDDSDDYGQVYRAKFSDSEQLSRRAAAGGDPRRHSRGQEPMGQQRKGQVARMQNEILSEDARGGCTCSEEPAGLRAMEGCGLSLERRKKLKQQAVSSSPSATPSGEIPLSIAPISEQFSKLTAL